MARLGGPRQKIGRTARTKSTPRESDDQTELEAELASSGRSDQVPRQGLVGAHTARLEPEPKLDDDRAEPPTGRGSDVAPSRLAEQRERERHFLERQRGRSAAGEGGSLRERRRPNVTRNDLVQAQREADRKVIGHEIPLKGS
jgi:hypothetical protein